MTGSLTAFFSVLASYNYCFSLLVRVLYVFHEIQCILYLAEYTMIK